MKLFIEIGILKKYIWLQYVQNENSLCHYFTGYTGLITSLALAIIRSSYELRNLRCLRLQLIITWSLPNRIQG